MAKSNNYICVNAYGKYVRRNQRFLEYIDNNNYLQFILYQIIEYLWRNKWLTRAVSGMEKRVCSVLLSSCV